MFLLLYFFIFSLLFKIKFFFNNLFLTLKKIAPRLKKVIKDDLEYT
jgi:hypothetical protein